MRYYIFSFLPTSVECNCKDYIEKVESSDTKLKPSSMWYSYQKEILTNVVSCLKSSSIYHEKWSKKDYLAFRNIITQIKEEEIPIVFDSLLSYFSISDEKIFYAFFT